MGRIMQRDITNYEALTNGDSYCQLAPAFKTIPTVAAPSGPTIFFGENLTPAGSVVGNPVTARTSFLAALSGTLVPYGFENRSSGDVAPFNFTFANSSGTITTTLTDAGSGLVTGTATGGRFNTTSGGTLYWKCNETAAGGQLLTLTLSPAIAAFGFYSTDVGDFGGALTLTIRNSSNGVTTALPIGNTVGASGSTSGCLLFFGFTDKTATYDQVVFTSNGATADFFGFDDLIAATAAQVI